MQGYKVEYLAFSGISETTEWRMKHVDLVRQRVEKWPTHINRLLILDAMSSGTALQVMKSLINIAYKTSKRLPPQITLFALNPPQEGRDAARGLVAQGEITVSMGQSPASRAVQDKIYKQDYKEGYIGRLFPKSEAERPTADPGPPNTAALKRMVATLLADTVKR
jgi:hypothetical protein